METKKASIRIENISKDTRELLIEVIEMIEQKKIPTWFVKKLNHLTDDQMWKNHILMDERMFLDKISEKTWLFKESHFVNGALYLSFDLTNRTAFLDILCVICVLNISLNDVVIDDPYFGVYIPK